MDIEWIDDFLQLTSSKKFHCRVKNAQYQPTRFQPQNRRFRTLGWSTIG